MPQNGDIYLLSFYFFTYKNVYNPDLKVVTNS